MLAVAICFGISSAMGDMAMVEPAQMKMAYAAASSRMVLVVGLVVFVCFHVRNSFDTKELDVFLSRPISRVSLVLSYWLGFSVVAIALLLPTMLLIGWALPVSHEGFGFWALTLTLEVVLVVAVSLFSAFTLKSAVSSVMASLGFYVLARMMGFFIATSHSTILFERQEINVFSRYLMEYLAIIVPRLDFFAKTQWLVYGLPNINDLWMPVIQALIFIPLLLAATVIDFKRKQF